MNDKAFYTLEMPKILDQLARFTSFSGGLELALNLRPSSDLEAAQAGVQETSEARTLLEENPDSAYMGGVHDVRGPVMSTLRGAVLEPVVLLDIRSTLRRGMSLKRMLGRMKNYYPRLAALADHIEECASLQHEIARIIGDDAKVLDSASPKLAMIRRDMKVTFDRLQSKLNSIIQNASNATYLQEKIISLRNNRYVIPLKADFKGRIPGIIHDQSSSGATLWIEPLKTVEINNDYCELQLQEEKEIRRILRELCELVAGEAEFITRTVDVLCELDLILAKAKYAAEIRANAPKLVGFEAPSSNLLHPGVTIKLLEARHPLLDPDRVVPLDLELDEASYVLVITGPNTGGKTVALKTLGLMILMSQCGLHIPAAIGSTLSVFENIFADIGDEQSIEQSLSTFSGHMTNIIHILAEATDRSLVILDELGAGTDPAEGSALARAILNRLVSTRITTLVTTHHPELKIYSHEKKGVRNASVEFNLETLAPTYRLIVGLPGRSNALAIAGRLGLPQNIIEEARGLVTTEDLIADDLLDEITRTREEIREAHQRATLAQAEAETLRTALHQQLGELENQRRDILVEARRKAEYELGELRKDIKRLKRDLESARQPLETLKNIERHAENMSLNVDIPTEPALEVEDSPVQFRLGDKVWVKALSTEGQIIELSSQGAEVSIGQMRLRVQMGDLEHRKGGGAAKTEKKQKEVLPERGASPGLELDLRGTRADEALTLAEQYVDAAYMAQLPFVRIIHGKGTGVLRRAIRDLLQGHSLVAKYSAGGEKEGGDGVTVVTLVNQY
jgi:DNA mismatch repair protein MutS2